ncbi:MAG: HNH endonuclease [Bdellovibrionales bacterium]|nr:HNH endonuclease [Bdellovibrionales bacterium]
MRKHRDRARKFGVAYEPINPIEIFVRDGWECQMCGRPTPALLRGTYDPSSPELDHIVPMSRGGSHTRENVQCLCRACNHAKGASLPNAA